MHRQLKGAWFCGSMVALLACLLWPLPGMAAEGAFPPFLFAAEGARKIIQYGRDGKVAWEYPAEMSRDVWRLPNGNVLFCFNRDYDSQRDDGASGVMEVSPDNKLVWQFSTTGQVWSCQRLKDGNTLVGAAKREHLRLQRGRQGAVPRSVTREENRLAERARGAALPAGARRAAFGCHGSRVQVAVCLTGYPPHRKRGIASPRLPLEKDLHLKYLPKSD